MFSDMDLIVAPSGCDDNIRRGRQSRGEYEEREIRENSLKFIIKLVNRVENLHSTTTVMLRVAEPWELSASHVYNPLSSRASLVKFNVGPSMMIRWLSEEY